MAASENEASSVNRPASRVKQHKDKQGLAHKDSKTISSEEDPPLFKHHLQRKKTQKIKSKFKNKKCSSEEDKMQQSRSQGLSSPHPKRSEGRKPGSGWSHVLITNLYSREGFQFIKVLSPRPFVTSSEPAFWATMESSFSISQRRFAISSTLLSRFETKLGLETMKR